MKEVSMTSLVLKLLCLAGGLGNVVGNVAIVLFSDWIFGAVGAPPPADRFVFTGLSCLSFTMGVAVLLAARAPERNVDLLKVTALGKSGFAVMTLVSHAADGLHWFWLAVGSFDGLFAIVLLLQLVRVSAPDLVRLQQGGLLAGLPRPPTRRAVILTFSLTGTGRNAALRLQRGLERAGYAVDLKPVSPLEPMFRFPLSAWDFTRMVIRAMFRVPAPIAPIDLPADHPYDLLVVEGQTWMLGTAAPIEAIFQDPANLPVFAGRDAAALVVCRGAYRRNVAMLVRWLQAAGANVVGARGFAHQGPEPGRLWRLWAYLLSKGERARDRYGLSETSLLEIERYGEALGRRALLTPTAPVLPIAA